MRVFQSAVTVALLTLVACGKKADVGQVPAADTAGAMGNMPMTMQGMQLLPIMTAHLDSLAGMSPAGMAAGMLAHQDLSSRMMDAMGADMRGMGMKPDSAWAGLSDSLRQDLAELPGLSGAPLQARMLAHIGQMRRMMAMHREMMKM